MTLQTKLIIVLLLAVVCMAAIGNVNPSPPQQKAGVMVALIPVDEQFELLCIVHTETRADCQYIDKSDYQRCALINGQLNCSAPTKNKFNF